MAYEGLMSQIANPQMADIAGALDFRQQRILEEQKRQKDAKMKELIAQAIPGLRPGSVLSEMAAEDPERYMMFSKAMGIPMNESEKLEQMSKDVRQLSKIASRDPEGAITFVNNLASEREQLGLDVTSLRQWQDLATQDFGKAQRAISMLDEQLNSDLIAAENLQERKMQVEENKVRNDERRIAQEAEQGASNQQFGAQETLKDSEGNLFFATSRRDPNTGEMVGVVAAVDGSDAKPVGKLSVTGTYGLTANEKVSQEASETVAKKDAEDLVKYKSTLFDSINSNSRMLNKYNFAIKQLNNGAETGPVIRSLPNLKEQSILVDVVRKEIGMEILGSGLLGVNPTDRDVDFALTTAIPDNLRPDALKRELERRGDILQELNAAQEEYYRLIEDEGMSKGDILKLAKQKREEKAAANGVIQTQKKTGGTEMVDANGNRAIVYPDGSYEEL